jgi:hypothetical protein
MVFALPLFAVPKPSDIPPLIKKLESDNAKDRAAALKEIGSIGLVKSAYVKQAIPAVLAAAKDAKEKDVRLAALQTLGQISPTPEQAVPVFNEALKSDDEQLQIAALQGLTYFGVKAKGALPEVQRIQDELRKLDKDEAKKKRGLQKSHSSRHASHLRQEQVVRRYRDSTNPVSSEAGFLFRTCRFRSGSRSRKRWRWAVSAIFADRRRRTPPRPPCASLASMACVASSARPARLALPRLGPSPASARSSPGPSAAAHSRCCSSFGAWLCWEFPSKS